MSGIKPRSRAAPLAAFAIAAVAGLGLAGGCGHQASSPSGAAHPAQAQVWGRQGAGPGEFIQPRALAVSKQGFVYIADTTGRILKWTTAGKYLTFWRTAKLRGDLPEGPEGLTMLPDGNIAFSNTHGSIVTILSPQGRVVRSFGSYGTGPGQFLLVTGVVADRQGNIYCADYGGEFDRISRWSGKGKLLASWTGHGEGPRQFRRPCGLAISQEGDLLVADVGNGRIQRLDRDTGRYKGSIGRRGRADGELTYPFGVAVDRQGFIYSCEFGTQRVQKWSADGRWLATWGGPGTAPGKLFNPRGIAVDADANVYVADTLNNRVQRFHF